VRTWVGVKFSFSLFIFLVIVLEVLPVNIFGLKIYLDGTVIRTFFNVLNDRDALLRIKISALLKYRTIKKVLKEYFGVKKLSSADRVFLQRLCLWFSFLQEVIEQLSLSAEKE